MSHVYVFVVVRNNNLNPANVLYKRPVNICDPLIFSLLNASTQLLDKMPQQQSSQFSQKEGRIALAIQAFNRGQFKSLLAATTSYDVPYSTVYDRVNGHPSRRDLQPANRKLTDTEESTLVQ